MTEDALLHKGVSERTDGAMNGLIVPMAQMKKTVVSYVNVYPYISLQ